MKRFPKWGAEPAIMLINALFLAIFLMWNVAQAAETKEEIKKRDALVNEAINDLKTAIETRGFSKLKLYVPEKKFYAWRDGCADGDMPADELSFEEITKILLRESKGAKIYFNPKPEVEWTYFKSMLIETEGWLGEYPFMTFSFSLLKDRLIWGGACYSPTPELKLTKDNKFEQTYFRKPQLPRPGPRTFKDRSALMARIDEIVKFKQFDALEAYAVNKTLIFERDSKAAIDYYSGEYAILKGKKRPVKEVIEFLKKNAHNTKERYSQPFSATLVGIHHKVFPSSRFFSVYHLTYSGLF